MFAVYLVRLKTKMKTTSLLLLFLLLLILVAHADAPAQGFSLKCPQGTVEVQVGHNVTLNCKSEPPRDLTEEIISWSVNSTIFLNFKDRKMSRHQPEQFEGRVHTLSSWNVSEGKLSVEISSVNEKDAGVYTCSVVHLSDCNVTLIVDIKPPNVKPTENPGAQEHNTTTSGGSNNGAIIGPVVTVVLLIVALVTWLICKKRRPQGGGQQNTVRYRRGRTESPTGE